MKYLCQTPILLLLLKRSRELVPHGDPMTVLRAKRGFAQSRDCPAQTLDMQDPWFVVQSMDWPRNPRIARAQSID